MRDIQSCGEPVYKRIARLITEDILLGKTLPGTMLPSENALVSEYSASRETVRKGLKELENTGLVYAFPGKGYFVRTPNHDQYSLVFNQNEKDVSERYNRVELLLPDDEVAAALGVSKTAQIMKIGCQILRRGEPVAYEIKYLPAGRDLPAGEPEKNYADITEVISKIASPYGFSSLLEIGAGTADAEVQRGLLCSAGEPLLIVYRYLTGRDGRKLAYTKKYLRQSWGRLKANSGIFAEE